MPKFFVDFEFTAHVEVEAQSKQEAKEIVENMDFEKLSNYIQNFNVGRNYIEKETK